jgi:hypothetical protein
MTLHRYFPGHIHAFYLIYVDHHRRSQALSGTLTGERAPFIFSDRIQSGGMMAGEDGSMTVSSVSEKHGVEPVVGRGEPAAEPMKSGVESLEKPVRI